MRMHGRMGGPGGGPGMGGPMGGPGPRGPLGGMGRGPMGGPGMPPPPPPHRHGCSPLGCGGCLLPILSAILIIAAAFGGIL